MTTICQLVSVQPQTQNPRKLIINFKIGKDRRSEIRKRSKLASDFLSAQYWLKWNESSEWGDIPMNGAGGMI